MNPLAVQHKDLLVLLSNATPAKRKRLISILKRPHIEAISEVFTNFLKRHLTKDAKLLQKLKKYKEDIRTVARKKTPLKVKKYILSTQKGGAILSFLLPLAASVISSLLSK